jgi:hypothetical protein
VLLDFRCGFSFFLRTRCLWFGLLVCFGGINFDFSSCVCRRSSGVSPLRLPQFLLHVFCYRPLTSPDPMRVCGGIRDTGCLPTEYVPEMLFFEYETIHKFQQPRNLKHIIVCYNHGYEHPDYIN